MYNEKTQFTRLTLDQSDLHIEWSVPYENVTGEDMIHALRTLMIGMTFSDSTIESSLANYLTEHSDEYEIIDKTEYVSDTDELDAKIPSPEEYEESKINLDNKPHFYA